MAAGGEDIKAVPSAGAGAAPAAAAATGGGGRAGVAVGRPRPTEAEIAADWERAVAVSREGLHPTSFWNKCGLCLITFVVMWVLIIVVSAVYDNYSRKKYSEVAVGFALLGAILLPPLCACLYEPRAVVPSRLPRATPISEPGVVKAPNHSYPWRSTRVSTLWERYGEAKTLRELWDQTVRKYGAVPAFGARRKVLEFSVKAQDQDADGNSTVKTLKRVLLENEYAWETFAAANNRIRAMGASIARLMADHGPTRESGRPRHVGIYASTRPEWQMVAQACFQCNTPLVTVYATLGKDGLAFAVHQTEVTVLVCEPGTFATVASVANGMVIPTGEGDETIACSLKPLKAVVVLGEASEIDATAAATLRNRAEEFGGPVRVLSLGEFEAEGRDHAALLNEPENLSKPEDTAVIMFTSGSTGLPKGVVIHNSHLIGAVAGIGGMIPGLDENDAYLGYLPLAHVLELAAELCMLSRGCRIGYGSPFTLTASSPMVAQAGEHPNVPAGGMLGDAAALRPTIMAAVPAVMDRIRKALTAKMLGAGGIKAAMFKHAFEVKSDNFPRGVPTHFWDGILFDKIRTLALGGRVRMMVSGGGPLSKETQMFMNVVFKCPVGQGYGLTETCGGGTIVWVDDRTTGRVGPPLPSNDIKLVDWEEGGYIANPTDGRNPQGEVCISGANVTAGYYLQPEKTAEVFKHEYGRVWFYTGDIGEFDSDGVLKIIDRKKDLVKLSHGEYIALGKIEATAKLADSVVNICVYGNSEREFAVAVVVVKPDALPAPFNTMSENQLIGNEEAAAIVQRQIADVARGKLGKYEIPARIFIVGTQEWLPPTGLVTAALKLQRAVINRVFKDEINYLYGGPKPAGKGAAAAGAGAGSGAAAAAAADAAVSATTDAAVGAATPRVLGVTVVGGSPEAPAAAAATAAAAPEAAASESKDE